jgi:hypothetical protein
MPGPLTRHLRSVWIAWLRFEYRALAVLLPIASVEMAVAIALIVHLPIYVGLLGALPAFLARDAWRFAVQIGAAAHPA